MASDSSDGLVLVYENLFVDNCCTFAGTTFLVYEYLITFGQEVKLFWRGKWTGASILFFLNRYLALISYILIICSLLVKGEAAISWIQFLPWAAFSALRAFALSGKNLILSIFVFLLGITPLAVNFVQYGFDLDGYNDPTFGCSAGVDLTPSMAKRRLYVPSELTIASRGTLMAADLILLCVTWYTLPRRNLVNLDSSRNLLSFTTVLLRDGTIYFVVLLILNILHLVFTLISVVGAFDPVSFVTEFTEPATAVLVSRFLLDLQSANQDALKLDSRDPLNSDNQDFSGISETLTFARIVGSVGLSMDFPESLTGISQTSEGDESTAYTVDAEV
ncbi:hypothetical protein L226DRAFT_575891 [Lentinus tigrinus ALCF2SS1-7]|uniref:uncharacterized protein n=1 Tax=Lentinus tigrinus ALCF2SS1-7 TaxID=1328758 RepID=UPI0011660CC8|nr:hypothetical protein L226DRAFT_575891 [Lentinus tigrinus ALCF2SS1-7]